MILLIGILLFLSFWFFGMTLSQAIRKSEEEENERILRRLKSEERDPHSRISLEKKERLSDIALLERILQMFKGAKKFQVWMRQAGLKISPAAFLLLELFIVVSAGLLAYLVKLPLPATLILLAVIGGAPFFVVSMKRNKRRKRFSEAFPDAVSRMASALRAGYSLQMALEAVIEDGQTLVSEEFKQVVAELEVGENFEEALKKMTDRMDASELRLFVSSVILQRESGGNLAVLLDNLEETIRQRFELQRELSAATAQARLSGFVLSFLPVFVGFFVFLIHKDYLMFLFTDPLGNKLLWAAVMGQAMGFLVIRKITNIQL